MTHEKGPAVKSSENCLFFLFRRGFLADSGRPSTSFYWLLLSFHQLQLTSIQHLFIHHPEQNMTSSYHEINFILHQYSDIIALFHSDIIPIFWSLPQGVPSSQPFNGGGKWTDSNLLAERRQTVSKLTLPSCPATSSGGVSWNRSDPVRAFTSDWEPLEWIATSTK